MDKKSISIEKVFRFFDNQLMIDYCFLTLEFRVEKNLILNGGFKSFEFYIEDNKEKIVSKKFLLDTEKNKIITPNSHEDPLTYNEDYYFLWFDLRETTMRNISEKINVFLSGIKENQEIIIQNFQFENLKKIYEESLVENKTKIDIKNFRIFSKENATLNLHLGDEQAQYVEKEFEFKKEQKYFNFKELLEKYSYIGVQFSFNEKFPEIEEKYILVGQKGIKYSGYFVEDGIKFRANLPFLENFQKEYQKNEFICINSITDLIDFYKKNNKKPYFFESNLSFLLPYYKNTFNQDKIYSNKKDANKKHFDLEICRKCSKNYKCIQAVPSGLTYELFKKNIVLYRQEDCEIYKLID